jgi:hypothetical protein
MDTFGGDRGMAALINANEEEKEEAKVSEIVVEQEETKNINDKEYPKSPKWDDREPFKLLCCSGYGRLRRERNNRQQTRWTRS